ncbi:MAG TPA: methyltransferase [Sandaracinaceae bacterium LLY-WYZ-13_1]|nr:methyltransferase [Sandaracinaceae bacterium LLY-WYZ-13_1]
MADEAAHLERAYPERAPWRPAPLAWPAGGPRACWAGRDAVALFHPPGRLRAERAGLEAAGAHPARPRVWTVDERALILPGFGPALSAPREAVRRCSPGTRRRREGTRRSLLGSLDATIALPRALGRVGARRRDVDRWLDAEVAIETAVGPTLGGVAGGFWRRSAQGPMPVRWDRARPDGWLALELAALDVEAPDAPLDDALRAAHRADADDPEAADRAFELAAMAVCLREHVLSKAPGFAARARAILEAARVASPTRVRVFVEGPPAVDPALWHPPGAEVSAARARWLLANLDGQRVAGGRLRVRTEPPIRPGKRAPQREPRAVRRRRLFSRWDEGVQVDDEGLVGATPEALARRIAEGAEGVVLDGTCGLGALTIAHALEPAVTRVIAVDRDPARLSRARHNAALYGVADRVTWIAGDVIGVLEERRADLLVLDPPWGGRGYARDRVTLDGLRRAGGLDVAAALARHRGAVVLKLPRSFDPATLPGPGWAVEALVDERGVLKMLVARRPALDRPDPAPGGEGR